MTRAQVALHARADAETVLYSFAGPPDGDDPLAGVIDVGGTLYGTTAFGGGSSNCFGGCGTVFSLIRSGGSYTETVLYNFEGSKANDGSGPADGVIADKSGALYGTTEYGGDANGDGIVFKLTPAGKKYNESVLYRFQGGNDGSAPLGGLTIGPGGELFGTTLLGGNAPACGQNKSGGYIGCGTIFLLKPSGSSYTETVLYRFQSGSDGATPGSPPSFGGHDLYGAAATGGGNPSCGGAPINPGCGTVYKLTPSGKTYKFSVVYAFMGTPKDAANAFGGLVVAKAGVLFGVSQYGGAQNLGACFSIKLSKSKSKETVIHSFAGGADGSYPLGGLASGSGGALSGTTQYGGSNNSGIAFELMPSHGGYSETVLYDFNNVAGGEYPIGGLLAGKNGVLYGTASYGGSASGKGGTVFAITP